MELFYIKNSNYKDKDLQKESYFASFNSLENVNWQEITGLENLPK